jgi:hypothetical protein
LVSIIQVAVPAGAAIVIGVSEGVARDGIPVLVQREAVLASDSVVWRIH